MKPIIRQGALAFLAAGKDSPAGPLACVDTGRSADTMRVGSFTAHDEAALFLLRGERPPYSSWLSGGHAVDDFWVLVHIFLGVLIIGTLWRLSSYHLIASKQPHLNHLGQAMATQY